MEIALARHRTRTWIESEIEDSRAPGGSRAEVYAVRFGAPLPPALRAWVEQRAASSRNEPDGLDDLIAAAPERVLAWMHRKSSLADGTRVGLPLCTASAVEHTLERFHAERGEWIVVVRRRRSSAYTLLHVGLLRCLSAATLTSAASAAGISLSGAFNAERRHDELLLQDAVYAHAASVLAVNALRACHGPPKRGSSGVGA